MSAPTHATAVIVLAERSWRAAAAEHERISSARTLNAEQQAWDRYADLCNEIDTGGFRIRGAQRRRGRRHYCFRRPLPGWLSSITFYCKEIRRCMRIPDDL